MNAPIQTGRYGHSRVTGYGWAWLALCLALTLHIIDEALTDFLSVYNPTVLVIRQRVPFLPLPTFNFEVWLAGLIASVILLVSFVPFAFRSVRWMVAPAYVFGILMLGNALLHIVGSLNAGRLMPGVYSSPLLAVCSIYLLMSVRYRQRAPTADSTA